MANTDWSEFKVSGVTENTPKNILLGAGTLYKNFKFSSSAWSGDLIGATSGGTKLTITPEILDIEVDGVNVAAKGLRHKIGETAQLETNMVELTKDWIKSTIIGKDGTSEDSRFDVVESNPHITDDNYIENLAFVSFMTDGTPTIVLFDYAICTSGLEAEAKNKENAVLPATFECVAELAAGETNKLPYHIYTYKPTV